MTRQRLVALAALIVVCLSAAGVVWARGNDGAGAATKTSDKPSLQTATVARKDLAETKEARIAAVEKMVRELTDCEEQVMQLQQAGLQTKQGVAQAKAARLKAEIELEKLKLR